MTLVNLPTFQLLDDQGATVTERSLLGRWTVLYAYPKDNTPGCTQEACDFRDRWERLQALGAQVYGISKDSVKSHQGFIAKQQPIEFLYLSSFSFPRHPDRFLLIPEALSKENEKMVRLIVRFQSFDELMSVSGNFIVIRNCFCRSIFEIRKDSKNHVFVLICEKSNVECIDSFFYRFFIGKKRVHNGSGSKLVRHPFIQIQFGKKIRTSEMAYEPLNDIVCDIGSGYEEKQNSKYQHLETSTMR